MNNNVIPMPKQMGRQAVRRMAHSAVANGIPMTEANPFRPDSIDHAHFEHDYIERDRDLDLAAVG